MAATTFELFFPSCFTRPSSKPLTCSRLIGTNIPNAILEATTPCPLPCTSALDHGAKRRDRLERPLATSCFPGISGCQGTIRSSKPTPCAANSMRSQSPVTSAHESFPFNKMVSKTHSLSSLSAKNGFKMEGFPKYPGVAMWPPFPPFPAVSRALPRGDKEAYLWIAGDGWRWLEHLIENDIDIQRTKDGFLRCFKFNHFWNCPKTTMSSDMQGMSWLFVCTSGPFYSECGCAAKHWKKRSSQVCAWHLTYWTYCIELCQMLPICNVIYIRVYIHIICVSCKSKCLEDKLWSCVIMAFSRPFTAGFRLRLEVWSLLPRPESVQMWFTMASTQR